MTALDRDYVNLDAGSRLKVSPLKYNLEGLEQEVRSQIVKFDIAAIAGFTLASDLAAFLVSIQSRRGINSTTNSKSLLK